MSRELILDNNRGSIEAPAGCGKTQLVVDTLSVRQTKPYLVLTHTTAGVAALRKRLSSSRVPANNYVLSTIDGWSVRIANSFRQNCPLVSAVESASQYYPELRSVVSAYLNTGSLFDIIRASYSRLVVDEYQDCNQEQHAIVSSIAQCIPTTVLGDPMQMIFNFRNTVIPDWNSQTLSCFPLLAELDTPWRWINANSQGLGEWVLNCRRQLIAGNSIDLAGSPQAVNHIQLTGNAQQNIQLNSNAQYRIRNTYRGESLLVIGDSTNPNSRHTFASRNNGIDVVEPVDLRDLVTFFSRLDAQAGEDLLVSVITSLGTICTGLALSSWRSRMNSIIAGRNRTAPNPVEASLAQFIMSRAPRDFKQLLMSIEDDNNIRVYRYAAFKALVYAVDASIGNPDITFKQAMELSREHIRQRGDARVPHTAIGSTLLLKGLETDHCLVLDAQSMNSQNLYVALSRGAKTVTVASQANSLPIRS